VPSTTILQYAIIESAVDGLIDDYKLYNGKYNTTTKIEEFFDTLSRELKHQFNIYAFIGYQKGLGTLYLKKVLI